MLDKAVTTILRQHDEDRCWSLYLASVANPFSEHDTFEEFLKKTQTTAPRGQTKTEQGMNEKQLQKQLEKAEKLLGGFKPPMKGDG